MKQQALFWFVHAQITQKPRREVALAVAAFTEASARRQARKRLGRGPIITQVSPVDYAHAWVMDLTAASPSAQEHQG